MFSEFMSIGLSFANEMRSSHIKFKKRTLDAWQKTFNMPRKKKKQVRKHLKFDLMLISYTENEDYVFSSLFN